MVEDSEDDAKLVQRELKKAGYEVDSERVQTRDSLDSALNRGPWDLVISDHSMPSFTSLDALSVIQSRGIDVPFIVVSGSIGEDRAVSLMKAGAHDFVMKDRLARLTPAIERELRDADERRGRRKAEDALRVSEQRYRELVEQIPAVTYIAELTTDRNAYYVSPQINNTLGITDNEHRQLWRHFLHPGDRPAVAALLARTREQLTPFSCDYRLLGPDGRVVWIHDDAVVVRDELDRPLFLRGFMQDITEKKQAELSLLEREDQLRRAQKLDAIGRLAGGVAHDFNNLLTPILAYSQLLIEQLKDRPECVEAAQEISKASERAAKLTRQLLAFGRKQVAQMKPTDINAIVSEMDRFLQRTLGSDIDLVTELESHLGTILADPSNLEQILMNLAVNARDAMPSGGTLRIKTRNVTLSEADCLRMPGATPDDYVLLTVRDSGCGMSKDVRERAFEPFFTTKPEGRGTGLGLSIIYGIVQQARGFIDLDTEVGKGTEFRLYFPRITNKAAHATVDANAPARGGHETILLVEDEQIVRKLTVRLLTSLGYSVIEAGTGFEALELAKQHGSSISLVLTDVIMPQMGGRELVRRLEEDGHRFKVLYTSGFTDQNFGDPDTQKDRLLLGKPFTKQALAEMVRRILDEKA